MKKKIYYFIPILIVLIFSSNISFGQLGFSPKVDSVINLVTTQRVSLVCKELSGDTATMIGGVPYNILSRHYNSVHNPKAAQYIFERLLSFGATPRYMNNSATSVNVIGKKIGTKYPNQQYIICAHYDDWPSGALAPGADDNASGVVGILEAARLLSTYNLDYTVLFIAFDEEERGLYGSYAYVDSAYAHGDSILGVINLDMIGYDANNDGKLFVITNNASGPLADQYISIINAYRPTIVPIRTVSTTANSDHAPFWTKGWQAFLAIEDNGEFNPYYHTVNDKLVFFNVPFFQKNVQTAIAFLISKANNMVINITHTPIQSGNNTGNRIATSVIKSPKGLGKLSNAPRLYYSINNGSFNYLNASYQNLDTFKFTIPGQPLGNSVQYYIAAQDSLAQFVVTLPAGGRGINPPGMIAPPTTFNYVVANIAQVCIGTGTAAINTHPFNTFWWGNRTQMLWTAAEISATSSLMTKIGFNIMTAAAQTMNGFTIRMQHTTNTSLTGFVQTGWTTYYSGIYTIPGTGWQNITLQTPFLYNGTSNLLVDICFGNTSYTSSTTVQGTSSPGMTWVYYADVSTACTNAAGSAQANRPNVCFEFNTGVGIDPNAGIPTTYSLSQNYPNPFNPVTQIKYDLPKSGLVKLIVFDLLGREVAALVNEVKQAGEYLIDFNGENFSSGVYYYKIEAGDFTAIRKMILIK